MVTQRNLGEEGSDEQQIFLVLPQFYLFFGLISKFTQRLQRYQGFMYMEFKQLQVRVVKVLIKMVGSRITFTRNKIFFFVKPVHSVT